MTTTPVPDSAAPGMTDATREEAQGVPPSLVPGDRAPARDTAPREQRRMRAGWFSWLFVAAAAASIAWFGWSEIEARLMARDQLPLTGVSLTIEPIVVGSTEDGVVLDVAVTTQQTLEAGELIATVQPPPGSLAGPDPIEVRAPTSGTVIHVVQAGSTVTSSDSIARIYRPEDSYLQVGVDFETLSELTIGMRVTLQHSSIGQVDATLERVEARLPPLSGEPVQGAILILRPQDSDRLRSTVPGITFDGFIDLTSGSPNGVPAESSFGNGG